MDDHSFLLVDTKEQYNLFLLEHQQQDLEQEQPRDDLNASLCLMNNPKMLIDSQIRHLKQEE